MVDRSPCPGQSAIYRCNVQNEDLVWRWITEPLRQFVVSSNIQPSSNFRTLVIGGVEVVFNITEYQLNPSVISAVAIISNADTLNGVTMTCGGQNQVIRILQTSKGFFSTSNINALISAFLYFLQVLSLLHCNLECQIMLVKSAFTLL